MLDRPLRLLAVLAMTAALFAGFLSAPAVSAGVETPTASLTFQVYTCPDDYAGADYLTDCSAGPADYELLVTEDTDSADGPGGQPGVTEYTDADGFVSVDYPAGPTRAVLQLSQQSNSFYLACFDTTSGSEIFRFDGATNGLSLDTAGGASWSCRWYVIPSSAGEPAPTTADGTFQVYDCELNYTGDADAAGCVAAPQGIPVRVVANDAAYIQDTQTSQSGTAHDSTIPPGTITVILDVEAVVYDRTTTGFEVECFDTTSGEAVSLGSTNIPSIDLSVEAGGTYACDFYITPDAELANRIISFQVSECPVGYTGDEYQVDCTTYDAGDAVDVLLTAGPEFDIENVLASGTTDDAGFVQFTGLEAGTYSAALDLSERVNSFVYDCALATDTSVTPLFDGGGVQLTADTVRGGILSCRWYVIPVDVENSGVIDVQLFDCPAVGADASDFLDDCVALTANLPIDVLLSEGAELDPTTAIVATTDADGRARFTDLALDGQYTVGADLPGSVVDASHACFGSISGNPVAESLFTGDGSEFTVGIDRRQLTTCQLYLDFGDAPSSPSASASPSSGASASGRPGAQPSGGPVTGLPSTGAGPSDSPAWSGAALAVAMLALAAVAFAARRLVASRG